MLPKVGKNGPMLTLDNVSSVENLEEVFPCFMAFLLTYFFDNFPPPAPPAPASSFPNVLMTYANKVQNKNYLYNEECKSFGDIYF